MYYDSAEYQNHFQKIIEDAKIKVVMGLLRPIAFMIDTSSSQGKLLLNKSKLKS